MRVALAGALALSGALVAVASVPAPAAAEPCGPQGNEIACENSKPGTDPAVWDITGAGDSDIQGFATDISVNVGQRVDFKIATSASTYTIDIYRTGWYGGDGARLIASVNPSASLPQNQPNCITDTTTDLYDCGNWAVSASWNVPTTAVSGVYVAKLRRPDTGGTSHITFVVRDDASDSDLFFQTSDTTWQAYNDYGGTSLYRGSALGRATKVSYNRPFNTRGAAAGRDFYFSSEYAMVRFLERNGYDVSYTTDLDSHRRGNLIRNHKVFLSVGHDEYWSGPQRANMEAARDAGVNMVFATGNEGYWRTRWEPSSDAGATPYRTLVSYKETWASGRTDPVENEWTGTWRDPRFAPTSAGAGLPENALTGTAYRANFTDLPVTVTAAQGKTRLWRNTSLTSLPAGSQQELAASTVGYESNEDMDNGFRPPGLIRVSTTVGPTPELLMNFGTQVVPGTTTHNTTLYRAPSGALVFSSGSVQWGWGLDQTHDGDGAPADPRMQQAQVNLLADMGAQPTTLMAALTPASKSLDTTGPTTTITSPASGAATNGALVTAAGTASDAGGGVVAGVEYSTDGGQSWKAAQGTTSWTFSYVQRGQGNTTLRVRAIDDSANIGGTATVTRNVACPCSVYGQEQPPIVDSQDTSGVELGLRFTPTVDGFVSGVRFHKSAANTGTHVGSLWSAVGQQLATVTFGNETGSGWQTATFSTPVPVTAGQTYVASYTAPNGRYSIEPDAFWYRGEDAGVLAVAGGFGTPQAGVYAPPGGFPSMSFQRAQYYVDALFTTVDESPLEVTNRWPLPDSTSVPTSTTISARFNKPIQAGTASVTLRNQLNETVPGATTYDASTRTVTFTPANALDGFVSYTVTMSARDTLGQQLGSSGTWSFRTAKPAPAPGVCPCSLFDDTVVPSILEINESDPVTLGVRFSPQVNGRVTGVSFYKGPNNGGTHVGSLWTTTGTLLASATFQNESTSGWQTVTFNQPVEVSKNTEYIAAYRAPQGRYSATLGQLGSEIVRSPLVSSAPGGAYTYPAGFPDRASSTNYLVDVVFEKTVMPITIAGQNPAPGAVSVGRNRSIQVWFSEPIRSGYSLTATAGGQSLEGSLTLSTDQTTLTFAPTQPYPAGSTVGVALSGVVSTDGASLAPASWSFTTKSSTTTEESLFGAVTPQVASTADGSSLELGLAFTPARDGKVTGIRFFKGAGNLGTHTGSLWTSTGTRLATVTFTNETPSGWQTADLDAPVDVDADVTYVVSYHAPQGHYASTPAGLANPQTVGNLTAPSGNNGRYLYSATGGFPQFSWNSTNYFVDVVYEADPASIAIVSRSPQPGDEEVPPSSEVTVTLSAPVADGYGLAVSSGGSAVPGQVALSTNRRVLTFVPDTGLPASASVSVSLTNVVSQDGAVLPTTNWSFATAAVTVNLFGNAVPANPSINEPDALEVGTAFSSTVNGEVTGIRFYKGSGNTGTHVGSLWSGSGALLGRVTFSAETSTGWQWARLQTPVPLTAGETYVVSYLAPNGYFSATPGFFSQPYASGVLTAPAGNNGRYRYGADGGFPTSSWNATNYFVDVTFRPAA